MAGPISPSKWHAYRPQESGHVAAVGRPLFEQQHIPVGAEAGLPAEQALVSKQPLKITVNASPEWWIFATLWLQSTLTPGPFPQYLA